MRTGARINFGDLTLWGKRLRLLKNVFEQRRHSAPSSRKALFVSFWEKCISFILETKYSVSGTGTVGVLSLLVCNTYPSDLIWTLIQQETQFYVTPKELYKRNLRYWKPSQKRECSQPSGLHGTWTFAKSGPLALLYIAFLLRNKRAEKEKKLLIEKLQTY